MNNANLSRHFAQAGRITCSLALAAVLSESGAQAQIVGFGRSSAPMYGGTGMAPMPANPFPPMKGTYAPSHKAPDGTACISVHPSTRPQVINPKIIDQLVTVNNTCGQSINVQVCYAGSSDCITVALSGYQKLQRILGISAGSTAFRYEYRELY
ncbi:hypothetical protein [Bradyrhizobium lablabi]|uniref:hypothetical protein n=1 Tax=Bradyrhizobium lablabi TaxID=722472 RepID=UPI001BA78822|nr:hypothetical protein [Bradyrhizobium lablabi]MBR0697940.1 hypothetical protein [Bradyrhizobium lablabi]